jgi:LemA protein
MGGLFAGLVVLGGGWAAFAYNRLIRLRNQMVSAWADMDVQLVRRRDLIPSLVAAVKGYAAHERATLEAVTELRARAASLQGPADLERVETALESGISRLLALQEAHPDLKASENFARLQRDLVDVEDHLQYSRRFYNGSVRDYNTTLQRLPDLLIARSLGFTEADFFQAAADERAVVRVDLT